MKKKFVNVALLAALACGAPAMLTSCNDDDWKNPVNTLETSTADLKATLTEIDNQIDQIDKAIADNKAAAAAADKAAEDAMAAAKAANDEAVKASEAAKAASALAESAAAKAKEEALNELKTQIEAVKTLIQANADAIALNKAATEGNAEAIKANTGKIEGNTKAIEDILAKLALCATTEGVNAQYKELADKLAAAGVATEGKFEDLSKTITGLQTALNAVEGQYTALIGEKTDALKAAIDAQIGDLNKTIAVNAAKANAADASILASIKEINDRLKTLNIPENISDFTALQTAVATQQQALDNYKEANETKLAELEQALGGKIQANIDAIDQLKRDLATANAAITANQTALTQQINALATKQANEISTLMQGINAVNGNITTQVSSLKQTLQNEISTKVNTLDTRLNTMTLGQLRGLVFIPEVYVGGIESALSYSMYFKPMITVPGTTTPKVYTLNEGTFTVENATAWNKIVNNQAQQQEITPATVVSYHMNPTSATIDDFANLSIVSNDAEILSRASKAGITLDATYNDGEGFAIADGVISVAIKGEAPIFADAPKKMPVFALQAKVAGEKDEEGNEVVNTVTSDYAMFAQMNVEPTRIQYNMENYTSSEYYGNNLRSFIDVQTSQNLEEALKNGTSTTVAWNKTLDLLPIIEVVYNDIQRNEEGVWTSVEDWGKFGLDLSFQLVDYTIGDNRISESSWASVDPKTGVLTPCVKGNVKEQSRDELGHMPLVYMTLKQGNKLVLDGFIRVKIVPEVDYFETAVVTFPNIDFTCEGSTVDQKEEYNIVNMMAAATQMTNSVVVSTYKPVVYPVTDREHLGAFRQFKKEGDIFVEVDDYGWGLIYAQTAGSLNEDPENQIGDYTFAWVLETLDEQKIYEQPNHSGTTYVCFESGNESYPDIFIPLNITVNEKSVYTIGDKFEARWFRNMSTALLNVMPPYNGEQIDPLDNTINTVLNQLWQGGVPKFAWVSGAPKPTSGVLAPAGYKYYFTAANNTTVAGVKYTVENGMNPCLLDFQKNVASNANMGDHALLVTEANSEYNNTVLKANGEVLATLDPTNGQITLADNETARALLNKFPSMSLNGEPAEDRMAAKLQAIVGVVPYSSCDIAYALTNPQFTAIFLRPINVDPTKEYDFIDAFVNGQPQDIYGMLKFTDWRNQNFENSEWFYGYYDVKSVVPDLNKMTTNAGTVETAPDKFVIDPTVCAAFKVDQTATATTPVTYNSADINPDGSGAIKDQLTEAFGTITYNNTLLNVKKFTVKIPFEVTYGLGKFTVEVTCNIDATMPNQDQN